MALEPSPGRRRGGAITGAPILLEVGALLGGPRLPAHQDAAFLQTTPVPLDPLFGDSPAHQCSDTAPDDRARSRTRQGGRDRPGDEQAPPGTATVAAAATAASVPPATAPTPPPTPAPSSALFPSSVVVPPLKCRFRPSSVMITLMSFAS